jgi:diguanylate cyclase (GGDEF)-like protein
MTEFVILPIDIPTLALSRGFVQMMMGGLLLYLGRRNEEADGATFWAIGFLLNGVSLFVFPIQVPAAWEQPRTVINHLALGASTVFFLLGFWRFGQRPRQLWILVLLMLIPFASLLAWEVLWPNARLRILCTASGQVLFLIALQQSLRLAPRVELAQLYRRLRVVVIIYLVVVVWSYASIADVLPTTAQINLGYHRSLFSVASLLFMLSLAMGCLALQFGSLAARNADLAMVDWQTGLLNRRGLFEAINRIEDLQAERDCTASVIALDIDHFKAINDRHGHALGDRVLQTVSRHLRELSGAGHLVARMGGEEFCIVLPESPDTIATVLAETIRSRCEETIVATEDGQTVRFTLSAGVCEGKASQPLERTLIEADEALYEAKRKGRNQVVLGNGKGTPNPGIV